MKNKNNAAIFRSKSRAIALEPRLLFDGAGAVGVADAMEDSYTQPEQNQHEAGHNDTDTNGIFNGDELHIPGGASPSTLVIIDSRVDEFQSLLADLPANTVVRVVDSEESGLAAISDELAKGGNFDAVHIFSHGTPGSFTLGSDQVDSSTLANQAEQLSSWSLSLTEEADILLYGCDVAQGEVGQAFISELAHLTGADIAASTNATGAAAQGGDWVLESETGSIEAQGFEFGVYGALLGTEPAPTVTIDVPEGNAVFIGGEFDFTLEFKNPGTDGFGPYVDLYLPKGADGDDGIDIAATGKITYLGEPVNYQIITLNASGEADHPYAKNADGTKIKLSGIAGQKVVVIELPFGSFTSGQPSAELKVSASVSNKADLGVGLVIKAQSGFRYGNNALGTGGSVVAGGSVDITIQPTLVDYSYTFSGPEGETATGPNFPREMTTHIKVAPGQTLTGYELKIDLPNNVIVTHIDGVVLGAPITGSDAVNEVTKALGNITGNKDVVIRYYIPDTKGGGGDVLDATSGAASSSQFQVSGSGNWVPLDTRDTSGVQNYDPEGVEYEHAIKSLAVQKTVTGTNKPGGSLNYTLDFQVSDYFQFKDVVITDVIDDGHTLGVPTFKITNQGGAEQVISLAGYYTDVVIAGDNIERTYNISQALAAAGFADGILTGGKFDGANLGGTFGRIEYTATINDKFVSVPTTSPTNDIKHGDTLKTSATINGTVVKAGDVVGGVVTDATNTEIAIVTGGLKLDVVKVNGNDVPANGIKPGDTVTYELTYDLSNGDFADLKLDAFLPKPVFDVSGGWTQDTQGSGDPAAGHWKLMDTSVTPGGTASLVTDASSNGMKFSLGSRTDTTNAEGQIVIRFTVTVADDPFVDGLFLTAQAQGQDNNTPGDANSHQAIKKIQLNEPVLEIKHGIVSKTGEGVITGTTGAWEAPGTENKPFTGAITSIDGINGNITKIDAGDKVTFATGIINKGGSEAYDIATSTFTVPEGFKLIKQDGSDAANLSEANLKVYKGNGALLTAGADYTVNTTTGEITLTKDGPDLGVGRVGTTTVNDGSNILVITYDAVALTDIAAGKATTSSFSVEKYAGKEDGKDFLPGDAKITDTATAAVSEPSVKIVFKDGAVDDTDSSSASTTGADMVIGETMIYDIVVTLPEGTTHDLNVKALVPDGMMLDTSYNEGKGYEVITTKGAANGQSDALPGTFAGGVLGIPTVTGNTGALSADPVFSFGNVTVNADNEATNNSFVIRVKLIAANTNTTGSGAANNQDGQTRIPSASLTYDKGGNTTGSDNDKSIVATGNNSTITIREPKLTIVKTVDTDATAPGVQSDKVDAGDTIEYTITIKHAANSYDAYDLTFDDTFDSVLGMDTTANWTVMQGTTDISDQFEWVVVDGKDKLQTKADANVDLKKNETIVIKVQGTTKASVAAKASFDSDATVRWSSIDSANASERDTNERDGSGGIGTDAAVLNNYAAKDGAKVEVNASYTLSRVGGLADTTAPGDTATGAQDVAVGEIVRFRVVMQMPEGEIPDLSMIPQLGEGYELLGDGATWALVGENAGIFQVDGSAAAGYVVQTGDAPGNIENTLNSTNTSDTSTRPGGAATLADGKFTLGTIKNTDTDNSKAEYIVLEFNAIVKNDAANTAGTALSSKVEIQTAGTKLGESNTTIDTVVEPQISAIVKNIVDIAPGAQSGDPHEITVSNTFNTGSTNAAPAYDVKLVEQFPGGSDYTITGVKIGGVDYTVGNLPAGVTATATASGIELNFDKLEPGTAVEVLYTVKVPTTGEKTATPDTNATLTWSSLPGDETAANLTFAGVTGGDDGSATGERIGTGVDANNYRRTDPAGYGTISGTLWDDTKNRDGNIDVDEELLADVTVTLKWTNPAGAERTLTTTTDANGKYSFGALPLGEYTITAPGNLTFTIDGDEDVLQPRHDADGIANGLGTIKVTLTEGQAQVAQNVGYLQENDAPTVTFDDTTVREFTEGVNTSENTSVLGTPINLGTVTIADLELERGLDSYNGTTLIVGRNNAGNDDFTANADDVLGFDSTKVTVVGADIQIGGTTVATFTNVGGLLTITFNNAADTTAVNTVASAITYANSSQHPDLEHGSSYNINLRYRFDDANDNDKQGYGGSLTGDATIGVKIIVQNDPPVANNDTNGLKNSVNTPITGNVIEGKHTNGEGTESTNGTDTDPDTKIEDLKVSNIQGHGGSEAVGAGATIIAGKYGTLTIKGDGSYSYVLDQNNADVYGLAESTKLTEEFTYTLSDGDKTDTATLVITITGDTPPALGITVTNHNGDTDGQATVHESGLSTGSEQGSNKHIHTDGKITVTSPSGLQKLEIGGTTFTAADLQTASPSNPLTVTTPLGTLTITGATFTGDPIAPKSVELTYTYELNERADNSDPANETGLTDKITLVVTDKLNATEDGTLDIYIVDDQPTAVEDTATVDNQTNKASGNALDNDTLGADRDVTVTNIVGPTAAAGAKDPDTGVITVAGEHGELVIQPTGEFTYIRTNGEPLETTEEFTYTITDADGDTSTAKITITINDKAPIVTGPNGDPVPPTPVDPTDPTGPKQIVVTPNGSVNESGLPEGSTPNNGSNKTTGTITYTPGDGPHGVTVTDKNSDEQPVVVGQVIETPNGKVTIKTVTEGTITYEYELTKPSNGDTTHDAFDVTITDTDGDVTKVTVKVAIVDDVPVATPDIGEVDAEKTLTVPAADGVLKNDTSGADGWKVGGGVVGVVAGTNTIPSDSGTGIEVQGTYGKLTLNPDGSYSYVASPATPGATPTVEDVFTYTVQDSDGDKTTTFLTITVINNQPPVANNDSATTDEDTPVSGNILTNDSDPDGDPLTVTQITVGGNTVDVPTNGSKVSITVPGKGTLIIDKTGGYTFTPNPGVIGQIPDITYKITDGNGGNDSAKLTINVRPGNPPVAPPPANPVDGGFNSPLVSPADPIRSRGLMDSAVITDPSVFYEGERWDDVRRLPIPLQPVVYVNNEVAVAQQQREADDLRANSATEQTQPFVSQSISLAMGLGQDHNLFVSHAVRDAQQTAASLDSRVSGRLSRTDLSADSMLFTPDLRSPQFMQDVDEATKAKQKQAPVVEEKEEGEDEVALQMFETDEADFMTEQGVMPVAASFTEQLRGNSRHLPFAAREKNFLI